MLLMGLSHVKIVACDQRLLLLLPWASRLRFLRCGILCIHFFLQIWKSYRNDIKQKNRALWQDGTKNTKLPLKNTLKKRYVVAPVLILLHFNSKSWRISWGTCHFFWDTLQFKGNIEQKMSEIKNKYWMGRMQVGPSVCLSDENVWYTVRPCDTVFALWNGPANISLRNVLSEKF